MKFLFSKYVWFDGKFVLTNKAKVPVTTHAIHYGTSIFEGIRAYWNSENLHIFRLKEHVKRFRNSGKFYDITLNFSDKQIENAIICVKKIKSKNHVTLDHFILLVIMESICMLQKKHLHMYLYLVFISVIYLTRKVSLQLYQSGENLVICQLLHKQRWVAII